MQVQLTPMVAALIPNASREVAEVVIQTARVIADTNNRFALMAYRTAFGALVQEQRPDANAEDVADLVALAWLQLDLAPRAVR
jgi:hypothetical protein